MKVEDHHLIVSILKASLMKTLKSRFVLTIFWVYLVIGSLTLAAFYMESEHIIQNFGTKYALKEALLQKSKVITRIDREVALASKLADDSIMKDWCRNEDNPLMKKLAFDQLESYRKVFQDKGYFIALTSSLRYYLYDVKNQKIVETVLSRNAPANKWFFEAIQDVDTFVLNLDYDALINDIKVWINVVIKDTDGQKIGVVGAGIDISDFINHTTVSKEKGISTILIDRTGIIQSHENRMYVEHNANVWHDSKKITLFQLMDDQSSKDRLKSAIENLLSETVEAESFPITIENRKYLAAAAYIRGGIGWYNIVLVDASQVTTIADFLPILAIIVLSLFSVLFIIAVMLNVIILKPLLALTVASEKISRGEYDVSIPALRNDEIGRLTVSFNAMAATVLDTTQNLEGKIHQRTAALSQTNEKLEESQKQILNSIAYARLIQASMLPEPSLFGRYLKDYFILYSPRDVVGGDFYYFRDVGDRFLIAVVDCIGHGVPGAFITMMVNAILNHIVDAICEDDPARILNELNRLIRKTLHHPVSGLRIDSGLEIGLCCCSPMEGKIVFAGAGISLFVLNRDVSEIQGDRRSVGYRRSHEGFQYQNHEVFAEPTTRLYLTTDGILDQAGGTKGFGMGKDVFKNILMSMISTPMSEQESTFKRLLDDYRGGTSQRDDILLLGFSLKDGGKSDVNV